jgi:hypothetical protein
LIDEREILIWQKSRTEYRGQQHGFVGSATGIDVVGIELQATKESLQVAQQHVTRGCAT